MQTAESMTVLGIMSGTSLDGLDFALCRFSRHSASYHYEIIATGYFEYAPGMRDKLSNVHLLNTIDFIRFHKSYGTFIGERVNDFLCDKIKPEFIASHGHTVFHMPNERLTVQIGDGAFIAAETKIPVISDFRNLDTALSGQGAPLVPTGDKLLFGEFDYCINLGGFANTSFDLENVRTAYDICPVNIILNRLSKEKGMDFDKGGMLGRSGSINTPLLNALNEIPYYQQNPPKSLGREYVEAHYLKLLSHYACSTEDQLRTYYKHIAIQTALSVKSEKNSKILITGGGALNTFLMEEIETELKGKHQVVIPDESIVNFKEAIIFAFLGYLRAMNQHNVLQSVTGASMDHSAGSIFII
jgi:anhydro-N-acetylmuramic acid kinase